MRKLFLLTVCALMTGLLFCSPALAAGITLKFAGQYAAEHTTTKVMYEFKKLVEERSKGDIKVRVYPANQLGDYTQVYEELRRGTIEMAVITIPSQFDTRLEAIYLHYLATGYDEARKVYSPGSSMFSLIERINDGLGIKFLAFNVEGFGGFGTTKLPENLSDPKAPKKLLMRVPPMAVFQIPCDDEGFQTVSIPFAELYTSLQTGVADGWSGGPAMVNFVQFRDVIKYFIVSNNFFENTSYLLSKQAWDKMTPDQQTIVREAALEISKKSFDLAQANDSEYLTKMEEHGITVVRFNPEQLQAWADWCREVTWKKMEDRLTKEVIDSLLSDYH